MLETTESAQREKLSALIEIGRSLAGVTCLDDCLERIVAMTSRLMRAERSSIFLYDSSTDELVSRVAEGLEESTEIRFPANKGLAGHVAQSQTILNIPDAYDDPRFNQDSDRQTGYRTRSVICSPLLGRDGKTIGVLQILNRIGGGAFDSEDESLIEAVAAQCAVALENANLVLQIETLLETFIEASSQAIDQRDPTTAGHSRRVTQYSLKLARAIHASENPVFADHAYTRSTLRQLRFAGLLHDFGKIGVREAILCKAAKLHPGGIDLIRERIGRAFAEKKVAYLLKQLKEGAKRNPQIEAQLEEMDRMCAETIDMLEKMNANGGWVDGAIERMDRLREEELLTDQEHHFLSIRRGNLTDHEFEEMKSHVTKSYQVLVKIHWPDDLDEVPRIAHGHHEKLNGRGYPLGLKEEQIHFDSRVMCVADIYDALTASDRPYKKALSHEKAMSILKEEVEHGGLDANLVELFEEERCYDLEDVRSTHISIFSDDI